MCSGSTNCSADFCDTRHVLEIWPRCLHFPEDLDDEKGALQARWGRAVFSWVKKKCENVKPDRKTGVKNYVGLQIWKRGAEL